mgnify:CR=1 FL=1
MGYPRFLENRDYVTEKTIFLLALICSVSSVFAQSGKVYDALTLPSKILNMERNYAIYLPPDYETSQRSYPVLYLLHGAGDNHTGWVQFGEVLRITDNAIHDGTATPMIIVMPDGDTGVRGYANTIDGKWNYEELNNFLYKPKQYIQGTKMNFVGIKKQQDRADLILWLRQQSDSPASLP